MKSLCITGSTQSSLDRFAAVFNQAGAAVARPATRDHEISMNTWHRKVLAIQADSDANPATPTRPSRAWEQLAGDIFLANHTHPLWYWADTGSTQILEFWRDFDPNTYFLLIHTAPDFALIEAIQNGAQTPEALRACLDNWTSRTQRILRFHLRHPARSLLLDSRAAHQPCIYLQALASRWQLPLDPELAQATPPHASSQLAQYLAEQFLNNHPEVLALHNEVQASLFQDKSHEDLCPNINLDTALQSYLETQAAQHAEQLQQQQRHQALEQTLTREKVTAKATHDSLTKEIDQLTQAHDKQTSLAAESQARIDALNKDKTTLTTARDTLNKEKTQLTQQLKETASENELLLVQLHQVQEELERIFLQEKETTQQLQTLRAENAEQQKRHQALEQAIAHEKAAAAASRDSLNKEKAQLTQARDEQTRLATQRQAELDKQLKEKAALQAQLSPLNQQLKETASENELLLIQLHQVQEELENYFLQHQEAKVQLTENQRRLSKMQARFPDYWDYENLEVTPLPDDGNTQIAHWQFTNIEISGRLIPELRFKTTLINGLAGIVIQRSKNSHAHQLLQHWPTAFAMAEELPCIVNQTEAVTQESNAALNSLSRSDWKTLQNIVKQLIGLLTSPEEQHLPSQLDRDNLCTGLIAFQKMLAGWPLMLRYDTIELRHNQQQESYNSIDLHLENLQLGEQHWPSLNYKLATVDPQVGTFGQNPRLEFPESTRHTLQNWFAESNDDRGARLELRFAQPDAMDIRVWNTLSSNDQILIASLIASLPHQLAALQQAKPTIRQPWQDWNKLGESLKHILASNLNITRQARGA